MSQRQYDWNSARFEDLLTRIIKTETETEKDADTARRAGS